MKPLVALLRSLLFIGTVHPIGLHDINRHTLLQTRWLISLLDSNIQVQSVSVACFGFGHIDCWHKPFLGVYCSTTVLEVEKNNTTYP